MTRDEAREAVKVLQHYADGGDVQARYGNTAWFNTQSAPNFNFDSLQYRIKPKPAEGWATITGSDPDSLVGWESRARAELRAVPGRRAIHWREVEE